jgi:hypothetical protein
MVAAAREVMLGMLRIVLILTDIATMISPARAAAAPAVATKNSFHPASISTNRPSREAPVTIGHPTDPVA